MATASTVLIDELLKDTASPASEAYANPFETVIERDEIAQLVLCYIVCSVARFELTTRPVEASVLCSTQGVIWTGASSSTSSGPGCTTMTNQTLAKGAVAG